MNKYDREILDDMTDEYNRLEAEEYEEYVRISIRNGHCPECGEKLIHESGCITCYNCGWSACG